MHLERQRTSIVASVIDRTLFVIDICDSIDTFDNLFSVFVATSPTLFSPQNTINTTTDERSNRFVSTIINFTLHKDNRTS